ncbi:unnamed protein product, partial [Ambrosiozyma monospora]
MSGNDGLQSSPNGRKRGISDLLSPVVSTPTRSVSMRHTNTTDNESNSTFNSYAGTPSTSAAVTPGAGTIDFNNASSINTTNSINTLNNDNNSNDCGVGTSSTDFANKFRRLRACARCHRLKMRCVFEDPKFESCTRCFKAGISCSMTEDPTINTAKTRPRKKTKLKGVGPLVSLQTSINEATKMFNKLQKQVSETKKMNENEDNNEVLTK